MTIYKVDNVYYNEESIQQYIESNYSFADFISIGLQDQSGNVRGMLNTICRIWNSSNQNEVVNYLNALNYLYVGYVNNMLSSIPKFSVVEGGKNAPSENSMPVETSSNIPVSEVTQISENENG